MKTIHSLIINKAGQDAENKTKAKIKKELEKEFFVKLNKNRDEIADLFFTLECTLDDMKINIPYKSSCRYNIPKNKAINVLNLSKKYLEELNRKALEICKELSAEINAELIADKDLLDTKE